MPTDRVVEETVARCVSIMVCYHNTGPSPGASRWMTKEIHAVGQLVAGWAPDFDEIDGMLACVRRELVARYSHEAGVRIYEAFAEAFERAIVMQT